MSQHTPSCLRRTFVALLCVQIAAGSAGAAQSPAGAVAVSMQDQQRGQIGPNFSPPSAAHCARPVQTFEIPGMGNSQGERRRSSATPSLPAPAAPPGRLPLLAGGLDAGEEELAEVAVTGTRIVPSGGYTASNPITSITGEEMRSLGIVNVADALLQLVPQNISTYQPTAVGDSAVRRNAPPVPVTAGMVDDNADFTEYLAFRNRTHVVHRVLDISQRYLLQVRDTRGEVVPDAEVIVQSPGGATMWARTDAGGRVWLHPRAFDNRDSLVYEVAVNKNGRKGTAVLQRGQKSAVDVVIRNPGASTRRAQLDLVFLIDATGSMGDEIAKLKSTLHAIAAEVAALPSHPDTCFGLVAYRDTTDEFTVRRHDFTNNLNAFQGVLDALQAEGGGDYPEAMNEALAETVHNLSWRGTGTTRLVMMLADAPPHLDYNGPHYVDSMIAALGKGIKVLSVGASGLDKQGEYIQRQIAQYTGGKFVFLTYRNAAKPSSGPGRETVHDVSDYSVQTLDRLIVRLVSEELEKLPKAQ